MFDQTLIRICLIFGSLVTAWYILRRVRQAKVQIEDTIFWLLFSAALLILAIFPGIAYWAANLLGFMKVSAMAYTPKLTYKGRPLVRCGNDIYYGSMSDPYVVYLQVLSTTKENGVDVADKVHIVLLSTDDTKPLPERIVRQANKVGLYNALSFGDIMLQGALQKK